MADVAGGPRGGAPARGRGRGRGNRGASAPRGGAPAPLAVQMRQLDRLNEPTEMAVLRHLGQFAQRIRSTYGRDGLLEMEVYVSIADYRRCGGSVPTGSLATNMWISRLRAEEMKDSLSRLDLAARREARRTRLPEARRNIQVSDLTGEELRLLDLSQKDWDRFRAREPAA